MLPWLRPMVRRSSPRARTRVPPVWSAISSRAPVIVEWIGLYLRAGASRAGAVRSAEGYPSGRSTRRCEPPAAHRFLAEPVRVTGSGPGAWWAYIVRVGRPGPPVARFPGDPDGLRLVVLHDPLVFLDEPDRRRGEDDVPRRRKKTVAVDIPDSLRVPVLDAVGDEIVGQVLAVVLRGIAQEVDSQGACGPTRPTTAQHRDRRRV